MSNDKKILLSIPLDTAEAIKKLAEENTRSYTGQINHMLKSFLKMIS